MCSCPYRLHRCAPALACREPRPGPGRDRQARATKHRGRRRHGCPGRL